MIDPHEPTGVDAEHAEDTRLLAAAMLWWDPCVMSRERPRR